ncbi:hypothetical protein [Pseudoduganella sp. UC29_71]|uniref:hypothetical protein n=1 Tax=Pseudoduganella sp. UC29_71 TaxID=3350174 RepID=UPI00367211C8
MSIRHYKKDHLKQHTGLTPAPVQLPGAPESNDPLIFWTRHELEPKEVNLHTLATGQTEVEGGRNSAKFVPFTGRHKLIHQLAPSIKDSLLPARPGTVDAYIQSLRAWWRLFDAVEAASEQTGESTARIEDVRMLEMIHCYFAYKIQMDRSSFTIFRSIADATRMALGARPLYWQTPKSGDPTRHQPPEEQIKVLRLALKRECRTVLEKWELADRLNESDTAPEGQQDADLYHHIQHMRAVQKKYDKEVPTSAELRDGIDQSHFKKKSGFSISRLHETIFPTKWDADAIFHLCLCNSGWNPSTLQALDVTQNFLFSHPKDNFSGLHKRFVLTPETYLLNGNKARAKNKEQTIIGLWKTVSGPGHLIKTYMERVSSLRTVLQVRLEDEKRRYIDFIRDGAEYKEQSRQYGLLQRLEQGCRSVWLYVDKRGNIGWLGTRYLEGKTSKEGRKISYLEIILERINAQRTERNESRIPHVTPSDFRDFFATFVFRSSGGNILAVKRALGHAHLRTSSDYINNNVLNKEADDSVRRFLEILMSELGKGRVDLTILAHLHRHGVVTQEMEQRLTEHRALSRSRLNIGCKDPYNPSLQIRSSGQGPCNDNRCLLCPQNAVLLPESYDGISMRVEELLALQVNLPIEAWISASYSMELTNNLAALRLFDLNLVIDSRRKWADAIKNGKHYVPGVPLSFDE